MNKKEIIEFLTNITETNINPKIMGRYLASCGVTTGTEHILIGGLCTIFGAIGVGKFAKTNKLNLGLYTIGMLYGIYEALVGIEAAKQWSVEDYKIEIEKEKEKEE